MIRPTAGPSGLDRIRMRIDTIDPETAEPQDVGRSGAAELSILLVEDERSIRIALTRELRAAGYDVQPAASAEEALALLDASGSRADLVLTDVVLPGMTGTELVQRLRYLGARCPALYMSAHLEETLIQDGRIAPGSPLLAKPFTEEELLAKVHELLPS